MTPRVVTMTRDFIRGCSFPCSVLSTHGIQRRNPGGTEGGVYLAVNIALGVLGLFLLFAGLRRHDAGRADDAR